MESRAISLLLACTSEKKYLQISRNGKKMRAKGSIMPEEKLRSPWINDFMKGRLKILKNDECLHLY